MGCDLGSQSLSRIREHLNGERGSSRDRILSIFRGGHKIIILSIEGNWFIAIGNGRHNYRKGERENKSCAIGLDLEVST